MVIEHPIFEKSADPDALVWRYMDFTKFVDILDTKSVFFARSDEFEDRFEGSYPQINVTARAQKLREQGAPPVISQLERYLSKEIRRYVALNCWHMNSHESAAMWRLYLKSNEGIAIQSTYRQLIASFQDCEETIHVGLVKYIDYEQDRIPEKNERYLLDPFVYKRKSFSHENEIRAVLVRYPPSVDGKPDKPDFSKETIVGGINVPVNLERLISRVCVAPGSPPWLKRLVESVARKYGINSPVIQSNLDNSPIY